VTENLDSSVVMIAHITISLFFYKKRTVSVYMHGFIIHNLHADDYLPFIPISVVETDMNNIPFSAIFSTPL
jgi:hypothetical protein